MFKEFVRDYLGTAQSKIYYLDLNSREGFERFTELADNIVYVNNYRTFIFEAPTLKEVEDEAQRLQDVINESFPECSPKLLSDECEEAILKFNALKSFIKFCKEGDI